MTNASVDGTIKAARKALKQHPRNAKLHQLLTEFYEPRERFSEAVPHLAFLVATEPTPSERLYNRYMYALQRAGDFSRALQTGKKAMEHYPDSTGLLTCHAQTLLFTQAYEEARDIYRRLYHMDAANIQARSMAGAITLLITHVREGFGDYAARPMEAREKEVFEPIAQWEGQSLSGKHIILWTEQGIGDAIMFLGLMPAIQAEDVKITVVVNLRLKPLIERAHPGIDVLYNSDQVQQRFSSFDYQLPLGELMAYVLPRYKPAEHPPYLKADAEKTAQLRQRYLEFAGQYGRKRLVGLAWHTTNPHVGFTRNLALEELKPVLSLPDIQFVSLQYGNHADELEHINRHPKNILWQDAQMDTFNDLDGLAAQMTAMDDIITIDNATVHLAGALGVPTTLLTPATPDWRWGLQGEANLWYKNVRLERQELLLHWKPVIKKLANHLSKKRS